MVRGLYTAYTGMANEQKRLDIIANNLANAATVGYKEENVTNQAFDDVLTIKIRDNSESFNDRPIGRMTLGVKLGEAYTENTLLFPTTTGTYMDAKNLQRSWKRALENANIPYRKFHALRHTYATRLFENGTSILTVSRLLGHSSIKTTEIYTHVLEDVKTKEVECLNTIFN